MTDTLVIYESTCRGCAFEGSTNFEISDSLGIIKLYDIITEDNNPSDMDGGSISKTLARSTKRHNTFNYNFGRKQHSAGLVLIQYK
ncbi:MAG: hypothetical protein IPL04_14870 [Chitinophagaceae bacterium]|nr:hypothetical protein [Chitinophagaceae bacterium]